MTEPDRTQTALAAFSLFRDELRLRALDLLADETTPVAVPTLASRLSERLDERSVSAAELERQLHHVHLPVLADSGVIAYEPAAKQIATVDDDRLDTLVETTQHLLESVRGSDE